MTIPLTTKGFGFSTTEQRRGGVQREPGYADVEAVGEQRRSLRQAPRLLWLELSQLTRT